ncbi:MAG: exosortase E/protease, VPEID-CTERM system [Planctomycetaceae bacterium]
MTRKILLRLVVILLLPLLELLAITLTYDTAMLAGDDAGGVGWLKQVRYLPPFAIASTVAFGALMFARNGTRWNTLFHHFANHATWQRATCAHLAVYGIAFLLTHALFNGQAQSFLIVFFWFAFIAATGLTWCVTVLPAALLWEGLRTYWGVGMLSCLIGAGTLVAGTWTQGIWQPLTDITFRGVSAAISLIYQDVVSEPSLQQIGANSFVVSIAPECSGYEGLGLFLILSVVFLIGFRRQLRFPQVLIVVPLGLSIIWSLNILRIIILIVIGVEWSEDVAIQGFHSQGGWIFFSAATIGIGWLTVNSPLAIRGDRSGPHDERTLKGNASDAYLIPIILLICVQMMTGAVQAGFDWLYPLRVIVLLPALWFYRGTFINRPWSWSWYSAINGLVVFGLWMALEPSAPTSTPAPEVLASASPLERNFWIFFRVVGSCLTVPIVEEVAFRGYLMRRLASRQFEEVIPASVAWQWVVISSVMFGMLHGRWLAGILAGLCYALEYRRRGRLSDPIVAHATSNLAIAAVVLLGGRWSLWL